MPKEKPKKLNTFDELNSLRNEVTKEEREENRKKEKNWREKIKQKAKEEERRKGKTEKEPKEEGEENQEEAIKKLIKIREKREREKNKQAVNKLLVGINNYFTQKHLMETQKQETQDEKEKKIENIAKVLEIEKSELMKESWLKIFLEFKEKLDSKSYIEEINKKEQKNGGFDRKYFTEKWPYSVYAIAGAINYKELLNLFKNGKVKDLAYVFSKEELRENFSEIKINKKEKINGKEKNTEKTILDICKEQKERAQKSIVGIENANNSAIEKNLNLLNTPLGEIILHDYISLGKYPNGTDKTNVIYSDLGYLATRAFGFDTFIEFNEKNNYFSVTSKNKLKLKELGEKLGMKNLDNIFVLSRGLNGMSKEDFLNVIETKILENAKGNIKDGVTVNPKMEEVERRNGKKENSPKKDFRSLIENGNTEDIELTPELEEFIDMEIERISKQMEEYDKKLEELDREIGDYDKIKIESVESAPQTQKKAEDLSNLEVLNSPVGKLRYFAMPNNDNMFEVQHEKTNSDESVYGIDENNNVFFTGNNIQRAINRVDSYIKPLFEISNITENTRGIQILKLPKVTKVGDSYKVTKKGVLTGTNHSGIEYDLLNKKLQSSPTKIGEQEVKPQEKMERGEGKKQQENNDLKEKIEQLEKKREEELKRLSYDELMEEFMGNNLRLIGLKEKISNFTFRIIGTDDRNQEVIIDYKMPDGTSSNLSLKIVNGQRFAKYKEKYKNVKWSDGDINEKYDKLINDLKNE